MTMTTNKVFTDVEAEEIGYNSGNYMDDEYD